MQISENKQINNVYSIYLCCVLVFKIIPIYYLSKFNKLQ